MCIQPSAPALAVIRWVCALAALLPALGGCARGPRVLPADEQRTIDRSIVEYPAGFVLRPYVVNLTSPTAISFDEQGTLFVAEGGVEGNEPHIFGVRPDGRVFQVYPTGRRVSFIKTGFRIYGPIGGMAAADGKVYVSHRDADDMGAITAFDYEGGHQTVVAGLPAQGDYGVTDIAIHPVTGRLFFGVGTVTNSGVVGLDNWQRGWLKVRTAASDQPAMRLRVQGLKFFCPNPFAGLFGGKDVAVTGPFHPFDRSIPTWIPQSTHSNGSICSVDPGGGVPRIEAHGLHNPRGLGFNAIGRLYMTDCGMELRGSRPVKNDPDVLFWWVRDVWYGWPDYSRDLYPITDERFKPPRHLSAPFGYEDLSFVIDHEASQLLKPSRDVLLAGVFPSLSGAAKLAFAPTDGPWKPYADSAIVALDGDRAPFATGGPKGEKLLKPVGYKVVRVDMDTKQVVDFVRNTKGVPGSLLENGQALERPIDVKFHPADGSLYLLDFGQLEMKGGQEKVTDGTGRILRLVPVPGHEPAARVAGKP